MILLIQKRSKNMKCLRIWKKDGGFAQLKEKNDDNGKEEEIFLATDGTNNLFEINPIDWSVIKKTPIVGKDGKNLQLLNDLEVINNRIFVNIYLEPTIVELDENYKFKRAYDFSQLRKEVFGSDVFFSNGFSDDPAYCLNGIAFDSATNRIYVTGKKWPYVYEIEFCEFN
eukprot:TRINITY_DN5745_c0_g1_i5.p1 TRINITY_DN5745_c0_g1~~TRINITY_DN5745_c0_g1_i5.p1  ORF type:complete len:170 (+),score=38.93 TRINITY_DN5745_c0_g1_i5:169-678(+)